MTATQTDREHPRAGAEIVVRRDGCAVRVVADSDLDRPSLERLGAILDDLIDGQGNLTIEVVLPTVRAVDLRLLDVLIGAERRLSARGGRFSATTKDGHWAPVGSVATDE